MYEFLGSIRMTLDNWDFLFNLCIRNSCDGAVWPSIELKGSIVSRAVAVLIFHRIALHFLLRSLPALPYVP